MLKEEKPVHVTVRLYKKQRVAIVRTAKKTGKSRSQVVREAIDAYDG